MGRDPETQIDECPACGAERIAYGTPLRDGTFKRFDKHVRNEHTAEDFGYDPYEPEPV